MPGFANHLKHIHRHDHVSVHHRWALGVLIFELVAGLPPFMDEDRLAMFRKACARDITWPKHFSPVSRMCQPWDDSSQQQCCSAAMHITPEWQSHGYEDVSASEHNTQRAPD
jgi:hypothetical protein